MQSEIRDSPHARIIEPRRALTLILMGAFGLSLLSVDWTSGVLQPRGLSAMAEILSAFFRPELDVEILTKAALAAWQTVAYSAGGLLLALIIGAPLGAVASGTLTSCRSCSLTQIVSIRLLLAFFRSIHELIWALLFISAFGFSPLVAVLALGIPYGGILGRIYAELLQDVPTAPLDAMRRTGASELKVFLYGRLPMALPDIISYTFYRFECGIRSAAILGWVGLGGLGFQMQIALDDLAYERAWTFLWVLIILVIIVDRWSTEVRKRLVP